MSLSAEISGLAADLQDIAADVQALEVEAENQKLRADALEAEIQRLTLIPMLVADRLDTVPQEGPYHIDAPDGWASIQPLGDRQALLVKIRKDQPLRGTNKRCKSEFGPRDNPTVETYRRWPLGKKLWFSFDLWVPTTWVRVSHKLPIFSFRAHDDNAKVALRLSGDRLYLYRYPVNDGIWEMPIADLKGRWTTFTFEMVFGGPGQALTRLYREGMLVVAESGIENCYPDQDLFMKMGLYAPMWSEPERTTTLTPTQLAATPPEITIGLSNLMIGNEQNKLTDFL